MEHKIKKVSLIMTTYNCHDQFLISIESALAQDYPDIELVIVDGGSTDGTVDLIREYADKISKDREKYGNFTCKWISEPDKGIYDGMNKGIGMSSGDIIAVFNDEFTCRDAVSNYVHILEDGNYDAVHSDLVYADGDVWKRYWHMPNGNLRLGWMPAHPTLYIRREVYDRYGLYKTEYRSSSDYEFMIRILADGRLKLGYIPKVLIKMFYGGTSSAGLKGYARNTREAYLSLVNNKVAFPITIIVLRIIRTLHQYRVADKMQKELEHYN
ncbi:glycosyltransferase family 2 protein [Butyrivibrio sp. TB]|uniref:glycosyltransferase family 2 protein n=1 Tax=Butyrivibrio sp. TB TaxID=1520809 RepID=UPI0008C27560|nr:glycosyltransferase family 2 protein [Butyrivibrio sp. TB]SEP95607.1 glycosyltransferase [Butyrivibrio sp. TB]